MVCIITGDIIDSRKLQVAWLDSLKAGLKQVSANSRKWEIYRGDSFQVEVAPQEALKTAIYLKACIKTHKLADVRMGIGLGNIKTQRAKLTEANGDAFVYSGHAFESLKELKVNLAIKSDYTVFDEEMNLIFKLALVTMDSWGVVAAEMVKLAIENENLVQSDLAEFSGRKQSSVSEALKRARFNELMEMDALYRKKINQIITT
ncbi:SatD family protein [Pedobacter sp. MW01-1-1]|uniref:SatD family protein n=1 Tax=Pedobacter sp. MW01-1-1 TaxID=3383027 RepID=UPI003FEF1F96